MQKSIGLVLAFAIVAVILASWNHPASAQGSPSEPTGGGWAKQVRWTEGGSSTSAPKLSWSWTSLGSTRFLPLTRSFPSWDRSWMPVLYRRNWLVVKSGR